MGKIVKAAHKKDIPAGNGICVEVEGKSIALFHINGKFFAIDDACTHAGGNLSEGSLEGEVVTCPWHGATFDVKNGKALTAPAFDDLQSYPVHIQGEDICIEI